MSTEIAIKTTSALDVSSIKNAALLAESQTLANLQADIVNGIANAVGSIESIRREQAKVLDRIQSTKLYEKDGFKSLAEYAAKIGLEKSNAHALASTGRVYNDKKAPKELREMSPSKVATLAAALKADKDAVYADAKAGMFNDKTQAQLKAYAQDFKAKRTPVKVVQTYKAYNAYGNAQLIPESGDSANHDYTLDEWKSYFESNGSTVVKLPNAETTVTNAKTGETTTKANITRWLVLDADSPKVYLFKAYKPHSNEPPIPKNPRDVFINNARDAGMDTDAINRTCAVMGWEPYKE